MFEPYLEVTRVEHIDPKELWGREGFIMDRKYIGKKPELEYWR